MCWLGPMGGVTYELPHTSSNRVFVRYLPSGVTAGVDKPYLTVATYPCAATEQASRQPGAVAVEAGEVVFYPCAGARRVEDLDLVGGAVSVKGDALRSRAVVRALAAGVGHPIHWLGAAIGASAPYLTVATDPFPSAYAVLRGVARKDGGQPFRLAGGSLAVVDVQYLKSIRFAYPNSAYQIEVFDPSPAEACAVVASGQVDALR